MSDWPETNGNMFFTQNHICGAEFKDVLPAPNLGGGIGNELEDIDCDWQVVVQQYKDDSLHRQIDRIKGGDGWHYRDTTYVDGKPTFQVYRYEANEDMIW